MRWLAKRFMTKGISMRALFIILLCFTLVGGGAVSAQNLQAVMDTVMTEEDGGTVRAELKWGYQSAVGQWTVYPVFDFAGEFSEGMAAVGLKENGIWHYGFIDATGKLVVPLMYDEVGTFSEGMAFAAILNIPWEDKPVGTVYNKVGYINKQNEMKVLLPDKYSRPSSRCYYIGSGFSGGIARLKISDAAMCPSYGPIAVDTSSNVMVIKEED